MTNKAAPGWYDDPEDLQQKRYWDGASWGQTSQQYHAQFPSVMPPPIPERKPLHKRWWVWTIAVFLLISGCGVLLDSGTGRVTTTVTRLDKPTPTVRTATTRKAHFTAEEMADKCWSCLLYTSDAADE